MRFDNPYMQDLESLDRRNNPPMPYEAMRDEAFRDWAALFAAFVLMSLFFAGAVYPWKHELAALPFFVLFVGGMWCLAGGRKQ